MKKIIFSALALAALASCSKTDEVTTITTDGEVRITSSITSRTSGNNWSDADKIGIYMSTNGGANLGDLGENVPYVTTTANGLGNFTASSSTTLYYPASGGVDLLAYYPYDEDSAFDETKFPVDVTVQTTQGDIDLMVATVTNQAKTTSAVALTFNHKLSRIQVTLDDGAGLADTDLADATVKLLGTYTEATFDLTEADATAVTLDTDTAAEIALEATTTDYTYEAIVIPQSLSGATLQFTTKDYGTFSASITTTAYTVGNEYLYTATLNRTGVTLSSATINPWGAGNGTTGESLNASPFVIPDIALVSGVYQIYTAEGLTAFASIVNNSEATDVSGLNTEGIDNTSISQNKSADGQLMNNIDLSGVCYEVTDGVDVNWTPIGDLSNRYSGTFVGGGYLVSGLYINTSSDYQGLFGYVSGGTIESVGVDGSVTGGNFVGGVVGWSENSSSVTSCYNIGDVESTGTTSTSVGGVVGTADSSSVTSCYNAGDVKYTGACGGYNVGGVVGNSYSSSVTSCYNAGNVKNMSIQATNVGGVVGQSSSSSITSCYSRGSVNSAWNDTNGGVVGLNSSTSVSYCFYDEDTVDDILDDSSSNNPEKAVSGSDDDTSNYYYCGLTTVNMKGDAGTPGTLLYYLTDADKGASAVWVADTKGINDDYPILSWQVDAE